MFGNCLQVRASAWSQYSSHEGVLGQELFCAGPRSVITARGTVATPQRGFSLAMLSNLARDGVQIQGVEADLKLVHGTSSYN
jgi:hypothetical protein